MTTAKKTSPESKLIKEYAAVVRDPNTDKIERNFTYALQVFSKKHPEFTTEYHVWGVLLAETPLEFLQQITHIPGTLDICEKLFFMLLRGDTQQALDTCTAAQRLDLKKAINLRHLPLMRNACLASARARASEKYMAALLGLLAGDLESTLPACRTWEEEVMARLYAADIHGQTPAQALEGMRAPTKIHELLRAIISGSLPPFLGALSASWLDEEADDDLGLLRVSAHLLIAGYGKTTDTKDNVLVHAYIMYMLERGRIMESVPYLRFLSPEEQTKAYASILQRFPIKSVLNRSQRDMQTAMCKRYDLDLRAAALQFAIIKLEDFLSKRPAAPEKLGVLDKMAHATTEELRAIAPIKWLEHTQNWDAVVLYSVRLARFWLETGRILPVVSLSRWIALRTACNLSFDPKLEGFRNELEYHRRLADFFALVLTDAQMAFRRVADLETYLVHTPQSALRRAYVPYGLLELVRKLKEPAEIMHIAVRVARLPALLQVFEGSRWLDPLLQMFAQTVARNGLFFPNKVMV